MQLCPCNFVQATLSMQLCPYNFVPDLICPYHHFSHVIPAFYPCTWNFFLENQPCNFFHATLSVQLYPCNFGLGALPYTLHSLYHAIFPMSLCKFNLNNETSNKIRFESFIQFHPPNTVEIPYGY